MQMRNLVAKEPDAVNPELAVPHPSTMQQGVGCVVGQVAVGGRRHSEDGQRAENLESGAAPVRRHHHRDEGCACAHPEHHANNAVEVHHLTIRWRSVTGWWWEESSSRVE